MHVGSTEALVLLFERNICMKKVTLSFRKRKVKQVVLQFDVNTLRKIVYNENNQSVQKLTCKGRICQSYKNIKTMLLEIFDTINNIQFS